MTICEDLSANGLLYPCIWKEKCLFAVFKVFLFKKEFWPRAKVDVDNELLQPATTDLNPGMRERSIFLNFSSPFA